MGTTTKLQKVNYKMWTEEEHKEVLEFFNSPKTKEEKDALSLKLGRTWNSIYNRFWDSKNPKKKSAKKSNKAQNEKIIVSHVQREIPLSTTIKIGDVIVETFSSRIKVNDVLIEV